MRDIIKTVKRYKEINKKTNFGGYKNVKVVRNWS